MWNCQWSKVRHSLIYMVLLPIHQVVVPRSPQQIKQMWISGNADSLNKAFLPKQSFQSFFKGQHWDSLDPEVHLWSSSAEELNCVPKVGEKLWKQQQQAAPLEPEKHLQRICSYSVNWNMSQAQFGGWFDSKAVALRYAGGVRFSAKTLEAVYAWKISLNNVKSIFVGFLWFFFCFVCLFCLVLFPLCSHCWHWAAVAEAETSILAYKKHSLSRIAYKV